MGEPQKAHGCAGKACTLTEVEIYDLTDFYTYERNFHRGPVFVHGVTESGKAELRRLAGELSAWIEDCPKGCICDFDETDQIPAWNPPTTIDIFGFGANGYVYFCRAKKRTRQWPGHCRTLPKTTTAEAPAAQDE